MRDSKAFTSGFAAGALLTVVLAVVVFTWVRPYASKMLDWAGSEACSGHLLQIQHAIEAYAAHNDGWLPPSLDSLWRQGYIDQRILYCPVSHKRYIYSRIIHEGLWRRRQGWS